MTTLNSAAKQNTSKTTFEMEPLVGEALDYSKPENWMYLGNKDDIDHEVDLFFLYPTSFEEDVPTDIGELTDSAKHVAKINYLKNGDQYSPYTNVYAPYYRQVTTAGILKCSTPEELRKMCQQNVTRTDVFAALDHYFENCNNGRPYIFASHSQGTSVFQLVFSEYMRLHPEYLERMVAAYNTGCCFPDSWFEENPQVKKATGETDTSVIVSFNTEAPGAQKLNLVLGDGSFAINPLNWKTDETPASKEENHGSVLVDCKTLEQSFVVPGKADAAIDLTRGALTCSTCVEECLPDNPIFGDKSYHLEECAYYFMNLRENGLARCKAFLGHEPK